jgi:hypothetical protein
MNAVPDKSGANDRMPFDACQAAAVKRRQSDSGPEETVPHPLACYSLAPCGDGPYLEQLLRSVGSLRKHNVTIPVWVMVYGDLPEAAASWLKARDVQVRSLESYAECLRKLSPDWEALSSYPVLPKYLSVGELADVELSQLLHIDCDTYFFDDVAKLFDRYRDCEWYGREEVYSPCSPYFDPAYIDSHALAELAKSERLREVPTLNMGVLMLNHGLHRKVAELLTVILDNVSRLMMWVGQHRDSYERLPFAAPHSSGRLPALQFPSSNLWILDEVAFWLALGKLPQLSSGFMAWQDFPQGQEFLATSRAKTTAIGCHYFSVNEALFSEWLDE